VKFNESGAALAQDMGAPVTKMQDSIDAHYEASLERAKDLGGPFPACTSWDEASGKTGSRKKFCHNLILGADFAAQPQYVAIITPFIRCGMGGLEIDEDSAVVGSGSQAIRGLYAGGEVAGGARQQPIGRKLSLLGCVVCGRVAGAARAKYILGDKVKATSFAELSGVHRSLWERGGVQVGWRVIRRHDERRIQCTSQETEGIQWLHNEVD